MLLFRRSADGVVVVRFELPGMKVAPHTSLQTESGIGVCLHVRRYLQYGQAIALHSLLADLRDKGSGFKRITLHLRKAL